MPLAKPTMTDAELAKWERNPGGAMVCNPPEHGTAMGYNYYGCRCDLCRAAWNTRQREYRREKRAAGFKLNHRGRWVK